MKGSESKEKLATLAISTTTSERAANRKKGKNRGISSLAKMETEAE